MSVLRGASRAAFLAFGIGLVGILGSAGVARAAAKAAPVRATATFAGGCFWCTVSPFEGLPGVISVTSGYCGGTEKNPTYEQVSSGKTGHMESNQIVYDPTKVTYKKLLDVFWHNIDPTQGDGQFCDHGPQYRSAIFYHDENQRRLASESREAIEASKVLHAPIVTRIIAYRAFWRAEDYHQGYCHTNAESYNAYRTACGRDDRLKEIWGKDAPTPHH
ncbi:MAG: peptide-methionine (S)-S-oxide reductase MsrA [Candidatus Eiseniibacteriota bacterium]